MESSLALALALPVRMGGYGLPFPCFNPETRIALRSKGAVPVDVLHCDLHWRERRVGMEYDSTQYHTDRAARDSRRVNALVDSGETMFSCTPGIVARPSEFEQLVRQVAHALGHRLTSRTLGSMPQRERLRCELFPWIGVA